MLDGGGREDWQRTMVLIRLEPLAMTLDAADSIIVKRTELCVDVVRSLGCTVLSDTHDCTLRGGMRG